jgi:hypothetical protein
MPECDEWRGWGRGGFGATERVVDGFFTMDQLLTVVEHRRGPIVELEAERLKGRQLLAQHKSVQVSECVSISYSLSPALPLLPNLTSHAWMRGRVVWG